MSDPDRPVCETHGVVMIERFEERGSLMIPLGVFYCLRCESAARLQPEETP